MTQSASPGIGFAFNVQTAKGSPETVDADFKKLRTLTANMGLQQAMGQFPVEVGGTYHPGGRYKMYNAGVGQVRWHPRLAGDLGYLLYALLGGVNAAGTSTAEGVYTTTFNPRNDICDHPWITARRFIPNCTAGKEEGEELQDAKFSVMTLTMAAAAPAVMDMGFLSINASWASDASDWETAMTDTYENTDSIAMAPGTLKPIIGAVAGIDVGGGVASDFNVPTIQFRLQIINSFSGDGVRPELIIGDYEMDDLVLLGQRAQFDLIYKWADPYLARAIARNGHDAYAWSPTVFKSDVTFTIKSPSLVGSSSSVYETLTFTLAECSLECPDGIVQSAGDFLTMRVTGTAETQATAAAYMTAELINGTPYTDLPDTVTYS
jgi:hypothetical protein